MPGDLEGSPALTFAPLDVPESGGVKPGIARRHDGAALRGLSRRTSCGRSSATISRGSTGRSCWSTRSPRSMRGRPRWPTCETALRRCARRLPDRAQFLLTQLFSPRIDRVLFAATKADHLHHTSHDRLEAVLGLLVERARKRAVGSRRVGRCRGGGLRPGDARGQVHAGPPDARRDRRHAAGRRGHRRASVRRRDRSRRISRANCRPIPPKRWPRRATGEFGLRFVRFRPPLAAPASDGRPGPLPHIRLDRALEFLIGDRLT